MEQYKRYNWARLIQRIRPVLFALALIGFIASLFVHLLTFFGVNPGDRWPYIWWLHIGIFLILLPEVFLEKQEGIDYLNSQYCPKWLNVIVAIFGLYAFINFGLFFLFGEEFGIPESRGFSGHWMIFYAVGVKMLYCALFCSGKNAIHANTETPSLQKMLLASQSRGRGISTANTPFSSYSLRFFLGAPLLGALFVFFTMFLYNSIPVLWAEGEGRVTDRTSKTRQRGHLLKLEQGKEVVVVSSESFWNTIKKGDYIKKRKWSWRYEHNHSSYSALRHASGGAIGIGMIAFIFWTGGLHLNWLAHRKKENARME